MFGLPEALMSFIRRQVGLRTDGASATGSLHAKVGDLKQSVINLGAHKTPKFLAYSNASLSGGTTVTMFDLASCSGIVVGIAFAATAPHAGYDIRSQLILTLDGSVLIDTGSDGLFFAQSQGSYQKPNMCLTLPMNHRFESGFKVQYKNTDTGNSIMIKSHLLYLLD